MFRTLTITSIRIADFLAILGIAFGTFWARHGHFDFNEVQIYLVLIGPISMSYILSIMGSYDATRVFNFVRAGRSIGNAMILSFLFLLLIGYVTKTSEDISRIWAVTWVAVSLSTVMCLRLILREIYLKYNWNERLYRKVAIIGTDPLMQDLMDWFKRSDSKTVSIDTVIRLDGAAGQEHRIEDQLSKFETKCEMSKPDDIVIAVPGSNSEIISALVPKLIHYDSNIILCLDSAFANLPFRKFDSSLGIPAIQVISRPFRDWDTIIKWLEDKILGLLFLILAIPVMGLVALAIRIESPGPVFFRQERMGHGNNRFRVFKFRTMFDEADQDLVPQAIRGDKRVTAVGRFLRYTSLDELPQLLNVIRGEMSLVGPRPHATSHNFEFASVIEEYFSRHRIRPGITGWAQINGYRGEIKSESDLEMRVRHDIYYIENWSIWLDLFIIVRTLPLFFGDRTAY